MNFYSVQALRASAPDYIEAESAAIAVALYRAELPFGENLGSVICRRVVYGEWECDNFTIGGHIAH